MKSFLMTPPFQSQRRAGYCLPVRCPKLVYAPCCNIRIRFAVLSCMNWSTKNGVRLHDLRHTSATLALAVGVHAKVVQERLGHATISQTLDPYSRTTASLHEGAAETPAAIVDGDP
jgi:integrase